MNLKEEDALREDVLEAILAFDVVKNFTAADHVDFILSLDAKLLQRLLTRQDDSGQEGE